MAPAKAAWSWPSKRSLACPSNSSASANNPTICNPSTQSNSRRRCLRNETPFTGLKQAAQSISSATYSSEHSRAGEAPCLPSSWLRCAFRFKTLIVRMCENRRLNLPIVAEGIVEVFHGSGGGGHHSIHLIQFRPQRGYRTARPVIALVIDFDTETQAAHPVQQVNHGGMAAVEMVPAVQTGVLRLGKTFQPPALQAGAVAASAHDDGFWISA